MPISALDIFANAEEKQIEEARKLDNGVGRILAVLAGYKVASFYRLKSNPNYSEMAETGLKVLEPVLREIEENVSLHGHFIVGIKRELGMTESLRIDKPERKW